MKYLFILLFFTSCAPIHFDGSVSLSVGEGQLIKKNTESSVEQTGVVKD